MAKQGEAMNTYTLFDIYKAYGVALREGNTKRASSLARLYNARLQLMGGPDKVLGAYYLVNNVIMPKTLSEAV